MRTIEMLRSAFEELLTLCLDAASRGVETHAYLLGRKTRAEIIITTVLRAGAPIEHGAMTQPDYGAAAVAMQPLLARGAHLLGEAHRHPDGCIGPSSGDRQMLLSIPADRFPNYLCVVFTTFHDRPPVITAHSVADGAIVEHEVRIVDSAYPVFLPDDIRSVSAFVVGAGSGGCLSLQQLTKLGLGGITLADHDAVEERNLSRHLADETAIGQNKATYLANYFASRTRTIITPLDLQVTPATTDDLDRFVASHTFTVDNAGHPPTSILLSRSCAKQQKVCVHAGAFARGSGGFVFLQTPAGPCYECLYDLQRQQASDDPATLDALAHQYGYTEDELRAQVGLWSDVNVIASIQAKVTLEFLKRGHLRANLWVIDNEQLTITARRVQRHAECTTCQPTEAA